MDRFDKIRRKKTEEVLAILVRKELMGVELTLEERRVRYEFLQDK